MSNTKLENNEVSIGHVVVDLVDVSHCRLQTSSQDTMLMSANFY